MESHLIVDLSLGNNLGKVDRWMESETMIPIKDDVVSIAAHEQVVLLYKWMQFSCSR